MCQKIHALGGGMETQLQRVEIEFVVPDDDWSNSAKTILSPLVWELLEGYQFRFLRRLYIRAFGQ